MDAKKLLQAFTSDETLELAAALPTDVIQAEALRRGIELPVAGAIAVEGALHETEPVEPSAPEVLAPDTKESLRRQLPFSYEAYQTTIDVINGGRKRKEQVRMADQETVTAEFDAWMTDDKLEYVRAVEEADPTVRFTVVVTMNETVTADEYLALTDKFGKRQPYPTDKWTEVIKQYSPEEISGTNPANGNRVQLKLVPTKFDPEMYGTVEAQKAKLAKLQGDNPFLGDTSPLEDITRLYVLQMTEDKLSGPGTADLTYHRNVTMEPKRFDGWLYVPRSFVDDRGQLFVASSYVGDNDAGRASVG